MLVGDLQLARVSVIIIIRERDEIIRVKRSYFSSAFRNVLHVLICIAVKILKRCICCVIIVIIAVCFARIEIVLLWMAVVWCQQREIMMIVSIPIIAVMLNPFLASLAELIKLLEQLLHTHFLFFRDF